VCPFWPGQPATAHWGYADPSDAIGGEAERLEAFRQTLLALHRRLELFTSLPSASLSKLSLEAEARKLSTT
jgi:arsenate reductase (thioredoxin)